jgi:predicted DNA-binding transcriptional regulator AlpA
MSKKTDQLHPNEIVRFNQGPRYFGYKRTALDDKIKAGEIPLPFPLSDDGRAKGWTGQQILDHQAKRVAAAAKAK